MGGLIDGGGDGDGCTTKILKTVREEDEKGHYARISIKGNADLGVPLRFICREDQEDFQFLLSVLPAFLLFEAD